MIVVAVTCSYRQAAAVVAFVTLVGRAVGVALKVFTVGAAFNRYRVLQFHPTLIADAEIIHLHIAQLHASVGDGCGAFFYVYLTPRR